MSCTLSFIYILVLYIFIILRKIKEKLNNASVHMMSKNQTLERSKTQQQYNGQINNKVSLQQKSRQPIKSAGENLILDHQDVLGGGQKMSPFFSSLTHPPHSPLLVTPVLIPSCSNLQDTILLILPLFVQRQPKNRSWQSRVIKPKWFTWVRQQNSFIIAELKKKGVCDVKSIW